MNIFKYSCNFQYKYLFGHSFVSNKLIWIYSDIHSCNFFDTNIFGHSFVSKFSRMSHSVLNLLQSLWMCAQWFNGQGCFNFKSFKWSKRSKVEKTFVIAESLINLSHQFFEASNNFSWLNTSETQDWELSYFRQDNSLNFRKIWQWKFGQNYSLNFRKI